MDFLAIVSWGVFPNSGPPANAQERAVSAVSYGLLAHVFEIGGKAGRHGWLLYLRASRRR